MLYLFKDSFGSTTSRTLSASSYLSKDSALSTSPTISLARLKLPFASRFFVVQLIIPLYSRTAPSLCSRGKSKLTNSPPHSLKQLSIPLYVLCENF